MSNPTASLLVNRSDAEAVMPAVEEFLRALTMRIRARMVNRAHGEFEVRLSSVEVITIDEMVNVSEFRTTSVFGMLRFGAAELPGVAVVQRQLLSQIIGAMLGEVEGGTHEGADVRPLSPVEARIGRRFITDTIQELEPVWPTVPVPGVELVGAPGSARVIEQDAYTEKVFSAILDFGPLESPYGLMALGIPVQALRRLGTRRRSTSRPELPLKVSLDPIMPLEMEAVADVGTIDLSVRQIRELRVGQILTLGPTHTAKIRVNGQPVLEGEPGMAGGQRCVRVTRIVN
jgi:flagellar motor switch protein FliM